MSTKKLTFNLCVDMQFLINEITQKYISSSFDLTNSLSNKVNNIVPNIADTYLNTKIQFKDKVCIVNNTKNHVKCWWDREIIDNEYIGIPLQLLYDKNGVIAISEGYFCSYECVLAYLEEEDLKKEEYKNINYKNSKIYLNILFNMQYKNKRLKPASHWSILANSGKGIENINIFRSNFSKYYKTPNVILCISNRLYNEQ